MRHGHAVAGGPPPPSALETSEPSSALAKSPSMISTHAVQHSNGIAPSVCGTDSGCKQFLDDLDGRTRTLGGFLRSLARGFRRSRSVTVTARRQSSAENWRFRRATETVRGQLARDHAAPFFSILRYISQSPGLPKPSSATAHVEGSGTPPGYLQIIHREFHRWIPPVPPIVTDAKSANPGVEML